MMPDRVERKASELRKGDRLDLGGTVWTVTKAKVRGKTVRLGVESARGAFVEEVRAKARYTVVVEASRSATAGRPIQERAGRRAHDVAGGSRPEGPGPLLNAAGQMTRWASPDDLLEPPAESKRSSPWADVAAEDAPLVEALGARLVGVEVEGGKLLVPPVSDATILGHLLTMHGVRYDGVSMAEAKAWAKEHDAGGTSTASQVLDALTLERAHAIHFDLHKDLLAMPTPHWHRERVPR